MNEHTWGNLDTWERIDHELIREYLNDALVGFGERKLEAGMMAFGESNWKDPWIALDGWKEFSQSKTIMRGWHKTWTSHLWEKRIRFGGKTLLRSSNVDNDDEKHHQELLRHSGMTNLKVEPNDEKNLKDLVERHLTDDKSFLRQLWNEFENNSGKIRRVR